MIPDLRFAVRQLGKSPGFAAVAIATLALGIGACTAMFSIVHAVLLKPLPFPQPQNLVWIENIFGGGLSGRTSRVDVYSGWRQHAKSFESLAAYHAFFDYSRQTMTGAGQPERLRSVGITDNFLPTLGISLLHGRNFTPEECAAGGPRPAILAHAFWQRRFAGDPKVIGTSLTLNNAPVTIVGVLPPTFDFAAVFSPGSEIEVMRPFPLTAEMARRGNTLFAIGRLRSGVSTEQAQAELTLVSEQLRTTMLPNVGRFGANLQPLNDALRGKFRHAFFILTGAVACVLAIACVNLSNLLLARINVRRQEFAVRVALGARRRHLVRQALAESLLLAFAGACLGIPVAIAATRALAGLKTFGVPLLQDATVDLTALAVTFGLTTFAGIICGVLPALHLSSNHSGQTLQNATHQRSAGRSSSLVRNALVIAEVTLACILLVGAGLLFRSFSALLEVQLGFQPQRAIALRVDAPRGFKNLAESNQYYDGAIARVAALPGVESVGLSDTLPLGRNRTWGTGALGVQYPPGQQPFVYPRVVSHQYLQAMHIPLRAGRYFDDRDNAAGEKAVILNENLARQLWPDRDPIGQMITYGGGTKVIGVVANVRHGALEQAGGNEMYLNYRQTGDWTGMEMVVRSTRPLESLLPEIRATLAAYDPLLPTTEYYPLDRLIDRAVAPRRLITQLLGVFSGLSLTLASIGLYGVIAYSVVQRTHEIGIRMAIGAQRSDVLQLVLRGGLRLVGIGVILGLGGAFALTRVLQSQLFGVTMHDPLTFAGNATLLIVIATLACLLPAWRATRVDPMKALRSE